MPKINANSEFNALGKLGYNIRRRIGKGSFATVFTAKYISDHSKSVNLACKMIDKTKVTADFLEKFIKRELDIIRKLEHPYVIQTHSILESGQNFFIFMRFAENGDLHEYIKTHGPIDELLCKIWFKQMLEALHYLHSSHDIAHRDLKCENILLSRRMKIKLADFGFARYYKNTIDSKILSETYCGTSGYTAPEIVKGIPYDPKIADIWSLGIILFIMFNVRMPFDDTNLIKLVKDQENRKHPFRQRILRRISPAAKSIVNGLLEPDVCLRWSLEALLESKWIRSETAVTNKWPLFASSYRILVQLVFPFPNSHQITLIPNKIIINFGYKINDDGKKFKWQKTVICKRLPENVARREAYKSVELFR